MLFRKFNLIKQEINNGNYLLASKLLHECKSSLIGSADKALHTKLAKLVANKDGDKQIPKTNLDRLSKFDDREILPGISIVSCCMNRNENLCKALKTWLALPVDEIVIVDWSSSPSVQSSIEGLVDDRIKILRVVDEPKWILTYGFNVGLRFASYSKIYKFDADIEVSEDFLERNQFNSKQFVRGYWKEAFDHGDESQMYVNGSFGAYKEDLHNIGYYNELIRTYGWDDSDLYERLASISGLATKYLDFYSVLHMEQEEEERTKHQDIITDDFLGMVKSTEFNNQRNKFIGRMTDYWNISRLQDYKINNEEGNFWSLKRMTADIELSLYMLEHAGIYASLHFLWQQQTGLISKTKSTYNFAEFIHLEYRSKVNFNTTVEFLGESDAAPLIYFYANKHLNYEEFINCCCDIALEQKQRVFAIAINDNFAHESFNIGGYAVECLLLPERLLEVIAGFWNINNLKALTEKNRKSVLISDFDKVLKIKNRPKVYVDAQHGLGNRIRAIGSAAAIAKQSNRELIIVWEPDHHCECRFSDLFDYDGKVLETSFVNDASNYMDVFNYMEVEEGAEKDKEVILRDGQDVYLRAAYTFNSKYSHWKTENEFIKSLEPASEIMAMVKQIQIDNYLAVHVRMEAGKGLDHNTYDDVENWTQEGHDLLHFWRDKSHFSKFIKRIDKLLEDTPDLRIFLATDLKENYEVFENYYSDKLFYLKRDCFDRSTEQIKYGLADAILLSKGKKLLGSTWSSFSELAMRLSETYESIEMSGKDF